MNSVARRKLLWGRVGTGLPKTGKGFTFIEVMIAVAVFAVISGICFAALSQYLKVREGIDKSYAEMQQLQQTFALIERDLRFMVNRPVRDEYGDIEHAFMSEDEGLDDGLFRITVSSPDFTQASGTELRRIQWRLEDGDLYRDAWLVLDRVQDSEPQSRLILENVDQVDLTRYQWDDQSGLQTAIDAVEQGLPYGIELNFTLDNGKKYRRLFDLANGQ